MFKSYFESFQLIHILDIGTTPVFEATVQYSLSPSGANMVPRTSLRRDCNNPTLVRVSLYF